MSIRLPSNLYLAGTRFFEAATFRTGTSEPATTGSDVGRQPARQRLAAAASAFVAALRGLTTSAQPSYRTLFVGTAGGPASVSGSVPGGRATGRSSTLQTATRVN